MNGFVTALTGANGISSATLWADVTELVPFIVIMFTFAFGYHVLKRAVKSGARGRVGL